MPSAPLPLDRDNLSRPRYRGRFAPSPTGDLHAGSMVAALGSWLLARHAGGEWRVRIEDLDPPREVPGAAQRQLAMLAACRLHSDVPVTSQSARSELYAQALDRLLASGLAFECHCSRSALAAAGGVHRRCVAARRRPDPAVRLKVPDSAVVEFDDGLCGAQRQDVAIAVGDFVLRRADGFWAYQLAVVVDDAAQGITDVVRGADLLESTPRQILLQRALGVPTPRYMHLPLVTDGAGRKLSKSEGAGAVDPTRPLDALGAAWRRLGQRPFAADDTACWLAEARLRFDPARLPRDNQASTDTKCS
ncbi:tRNA glutamyl-Q(34) synthetase GluQRS [Cognatilysobacter bugurensis]|uniref:Glutamyl-Q tRNA(Asp) synthetase n=1 Tax=Cognatilysobacter bugurensis TaxID=543356 RepID=A0A918W7T9_9GAMM|nr:tRNA glutamyl-Q(34) synthetase GluQRS [Lysobacter bugurensis]GHA73709.1 glutamyl-Q tRNA(Asp) synthetase [Lysobacter bugurensis]